MSERLTDEQLAAIQARTDAATPGPWMVQDTPREPCIVPADMPHALVAIIACDGLCDSTADMRFIAAAREDVPALLAEIDTLTTERNVLVDVIMHHTDICVFGGGYVRNGVARRDSCKYGHPGCACADWMATRGLDDEDAS